jgi:hypothetical protein
MALMPLATLSWDGFAAAARAALISPKITFRVTQP